MAAVLATTFALALPADASAVKYVLTIQKTGTGKGKVECEVAGSGTRGACASSYVEGTELILYATPNETFMFAGWTDGYCSFYEAEPCELTMEEPVTVVAEFSPNPALTINMEGSGTVKCAVGAGIPGPCAATYAPETELVLYATPSAGFMFVEWTDEHCSFYEAEPCELTMEKEAVTVVAKFGPNPSLTINTEGSGTVKCAIGSGAAGPCAATYAPETELVLYATPSAGFMFVEWTDEHCSFYEAEPCELTMEKEEVTVVAAFKARPQVPFSVVKSGSGTGTVTCDGGPCASSYSEGREVTLVASAAAGSTFAGWSGGGCSGTGTCTVTIAAGMTVTATFNANPTPPTPETEGRANATGSAWVRGRKATLKLTCSGGPCRGTLKLTARIRQGETAKRALIGRASFGLAASASKSILVKLSAAAARELDKRGSLKAKLSGTGVASSTVRLRLRR